MFRKIAMGLILVFLATSLSFAGGWDKQKGLDKVTLTGTLVCIGCSLKKLDGANAQCDLYAHHARGFQAGDGTLWSIGENEKGHDIVRGHTILEKKNATITGWMYPLAHYIEIDTIKVDGATPEQIAKTAWEEDQLLAKRLASRKVGEAPILAHSHDEEK
ncbi:MAG: hypothetical protein HY912_04565 [Desulfomonile tiedjei]|uniref:Uncharacterized protein n=1 Tax=Desulfomonile tiedjei TaxID=2358 RepID=A0A9D6UZW9_9BACT|nr:hypothetical protein [Desulfomonile tiedjei]